MDQIICLQCKKKIDQDSAMNNKVLCSAQCVRDFFKGKTKSQKAEFLKSVMLSGKSY